MTTLKSLLEAHMHRTGSPKAKRILEQFAAFLPQFKKVLPRDYDRMLKTIVAMEEKGLDNEQAQMEAFYAKQRG